MKSMKLYQVLYIVDTGYDHCKDIAIIKAEDEQAATEKLECYIAHSGYEHMVEKILSIKEFTGEVFSSKFRFVYKKQK